MSQLWEGIDIAPGALVAKQQQVYLWPPSEAPAPAEDAFAAVSVDIDLFLSAEDAATYGAMIAAAIPGTADTASPTRLSADQVTAGSWASDQGFGGSTIVVTDGAFVILVTAARTGATELQATVEEVAAFIRARIRGEQ